MPSLPNPIRPLLALAALAAVALAASGCGTSTADVDARPRPLHRRNAASATRWPRPARPPRSAPTSTTPSPPRAQRARTAKRSKASSRPRSSTRARATTTPPSRCRPTSSSGQDLEDVAAYVGKYAGVPGAAPPKVPGGPGAQVFANNGCGGCHTLAAAESGGAPAPTSTKSCRGQSAAMIEESIVDPNAKIAKGYPANVMPQNFGETLSTERTRRPGPVPAEEHAAGKARPARRPRAAEPPRPGPAAGIIRATMRDRLKDRLEISPQRYAQVTAGRARRARADRPHRRRRAPHRLRASAARTGPSATAARCRRSTPTP